MHRLSLIIGGAAVLVVVIAYLRVALRSRRTLRSIDDFFIFNRRLRESSVFSSTFAAEMSLATVFIAFMTLAAVLGLNLVVAMITFVAGQFVLWLIIPAIKARVRWGETLPTFIGNAYDSELLRAVASLTSIIGFVGLFGTEILVGSGLFTALAGTSSAHIAVVAVVTALVVFYTALGGFKSVVTTDRWQTAGLVLVIAVLVYAALTLGSGGNAIVPLHFYDEFQFSYLLFTNFLIINTLYPICDMSAWQRIAAARDTRSARRGFFAAMMSFLLTWSLLIFAALALAQIIQGESGGGALLVPLRLLAESGLIGTLLVGLSLAALAAALLSTGDTFLIAAAHTLAIDLSAKRFFEERRAVEQAVASSSVQGAGELPPPIAPIPVADECHAGVTAQEVLRRTRISIVAMAGVGVVLLGALQAIGFAVADFVFVIYGSTVALLPVIAGAFLIRSPDRRRRLTPFAVAALITGLLAGWAYGIASVVGAAPALPLIGAGSAYNSPSLAVFVAASVYLIGLVVPSRI
jgi:Na+/proline symporter